MIHALTEMKGMVYLAARRIGCDPNTIHNRARRSPEVADCIRHQRGEVVDTAELKLYTAVLAGEPWAVQLCLKTLGRDRGYAEAGSGAALVIPIPWDKVVLPPDRDEVEVRLREAVERQAAPALEDSSGPASSNGQPPP
jgi:hypothetical protein